MGFKDLEPGREPVVYRNEEHEVTVQEVILEDDELYVSAQMGTWHRLAAKTAGERSAEFNYAVLLNSLKGMADQIHLLTWEGYKIPRGAQIEGKEIGWTQHGLVISSTGEGMGYYERLTEFGGQSRMLQEMLVFSTKNPTQPIE